jgi:hypothetical protein
MRGGGAASAPPHPRRPWLRGRRVTIPAAQQDASCAAHLILDWRASKDDISADRRRSLAAIMVFGRVGLLLSADTSSRGTDKAMGSNSLGDSGSACSARHFRSSYTRGKRSPDRHLTVGLAVADRH